MPEPAGLDAKAKAMRENMRNLFRGIKFDEAKQNEYIDRLTGQTAGTWDKTRQAKEEEKPEAVGDSEGDHTDLEIEPPSRLILNDEDASEVWL